MTHVSGNQRWSRGLSPRRSHSLSSCKWSPLTHALCNAHYVHVPIPQQATDNRWLPHSPKLLFPLSQLPYLKSGVAKDRRVDSVAESTGCFCKGPRFSYLHPPWVVSGLQRLVIPVPGEPMLYSGFRGYLHARGAHEFMQVSTYTAGRIEGESIRGDK